MSLRSVSLPDDVKGQLLLTAMPGSVTPLQATLSDLETAGASCLLCLNGDTELKMRSPEYHAAIHAKSLPLQHLSFPIVDFGTPSNHEGYLAMIRGLAERIRNGEVIAVHCAAGIGRTGLTAASLLMALGLSRDEAIARVGAAGSHAEDPSQVAFLKDVVAPTLG